MRMVFHPPPLALALASAGASTPPRHRRLALRLSAKSPRSNTLRHARAHLPPFGCSIPAGPPLMLRGARFNDRTHVTGTMCGNVLMSCVRLRHPHRRWLLPARFPRSPSAERPKRTYQARAETPKTPRRCHRTATLLYCTFFTRTSKK